MENELIGLFFALLIGFSLGLMGGGGSILTVPVLIYIMKLPTKTSIALSLAIVGITSFFGVLGYIKHKYVDFKIAAIFGPMAIGGTYLGARMSVLLSAQFQLILFAIIMLLASISMLKGNKVLDSQENSEGTFKLTPFLLQAFIVGIVTGVVGVGGGFLIVPALTFLSNLPLKKAIGTSLLIITFNSISGFLGYIQLVEIPWDILTKFSILSIIGIYIGIYAVNYFSPRILKKIFALFLLFMGALIIIQNLS